MKDTFKRYKPYFKDYKLYYLIVIIGILMAVTATMATAGIMEWVVDDMFINKDPDMLILVPLGLISIYVIKALGSYIQTIFMQLIGVNIVTRIREELLEKIITMDMQFLFQNKSGELISRITNDITRIQYFVSNMLPDLIRNSLTALSLVGYVIYLNPELAFYTLVVMPTVIYPLILITKRLKRLSHQSQEKNADLVTRLTEVFNNNEVIKANATEEYEIKRFSYENWQFYKFTIKSIFTNSLISPLMEIIGAIGLAAVIYMGGKAVYNNSMSAGEVTTFLTAVGLIFDPIRRVSAIYGKIQDSVAATERIFDIFDTKNTILDGSKKLEKDIQNIQFNNVSLKYSDISVLKEINLDVSSGQNIALVGDSGGGKSSFINLLLRFYDLNEGELLINNTKISDFSQASLRHHISVVSQRIYIFQDSLAANVAYGQEINVERVNEALELADAKGFASSLKDGIYAQMDEAGTNLSGGQRQRIAIARAIYKHASVLIFDEATSALDNESEKRIQEAIANYTKDKITFTVAHRLSTIEHADLILVFQDGRIVAQGSHKELLKDSPEYQKLAGVMK